MGRWKDKIEELKDKDGFNVRDPADEPETSAEPSTSEPKEKPPPSQGTTAEPGETLAYLSVTGKPPSLNAYYSGSHWSDRNETSDEWHRKVKQKVRKRGDSLTPIPEEAYPVAVECSVAFPTGKPRYDWVNLSIAAKLVEDGLVEAGILREDGPKEITKGTLEATRREGEEYRVHYHIKALDE